MVQKSDALLVSVGFTILGSITLLLAVLGQIPLKLGLSISAFLYLIGGVSILLYYMKRAEPLRNLEQKIPYFYLFIEMYLLSGISAQEGLKKSAVLLDDPVLYKLYRYLQAGIPYDEAVKKIFNGYKGPSRLYVSNLFHSTLFGTGGMSFLKEALEHLIVEKGKEVERITEQLKILTEVYTILGVFGPLIGLASIAALLAFGGVRGLSIDVLTIGILVLAAVSMAFIVVLAQAIIHRVKV